MEKDFDGNPITKDSRIPDWAEISAWRKKNPAHDYFKIKTLITEAKKQAARDYKKNQRQAARRIPKGGNKFQGQDLSYGNFQNTKLHYADMKNADLSGADLSGASLFQADMSNADLIAADLERAELSGAYLFQADMKYTDLKGADFRDANLEKAQLGPDPSVAPAPGPPVSWKSQKVKLKGANF